MEKKGMSQNPPIVTAYVFTTLPLKEKDGLENRQIKELRGKLSPKSIDIKLYKNTDPVPREALLGPRVYLSIGGEWSEYNHLNALPLYQRRRWLHYESAADIISDYIFDCWLNSTEPLKEKKELLPTKFSSDYPLVSIFTSSYKSGEKIRKPYATLLRQTYENWEWVIIDDSGDDEKTYRESLLPLKDPRIKRFRPDRRSGYIGEVKRYAAGLCTGEILVEIDHDDELNPRCLELIVRGFKDHPECGFAYGQTSEVCVDGLAPHCYGWDFGFGWGAYWRQWIGSMNKWQNVVRVCDLNWRTIRHLVGLPNHPRAWTRDCYHQVGGHRIELSVADDYDLLVRSFLCTRFLSLPHMLYVQYRNSGGDNFTFHRNEQIQILCQELERSYHQRINERLKELDLPDLSGLPYSRIWTLPSTHPKWVNGAIVHQDEKRVGHIFVVPSGEKGKRQDELISILEEGQNSKWKNHEVVVVSGAEIPAVEAFARGAPDGAVRWWVLKDKEHPDDPVNKSSLEELLNYALLLSSCKNRIVHLPHGSTIKE